MRRYFIFFVTALFFSCSSEVKKHQIQVIDNFVEEALEQNISLPENVVSIQDPYGFQWGLQDTVSGELITDYQYDFIQPFQYGLAVVRLNEMFGLINQQGKLIVPIIHRSISAFRQGYATVYKSRDFVNYIDSTGKFVLKQFREDGRQFNSVHQRVVVKYYQHSALLNFDGDTIIDFKKYKYLNLLPNGNCGVTTKFSKNGLVDKNGKELCPPIYDGIGKFVDGIAIFRKDNKYGAIDENGTELFYTDYDRIYDFYEGFAAVLNKGKIGMINKKGEIVIPFQYENTHGNRVFHNGFSPLSFNFKLGYVDTNNVPLTEFIYDRADYFRNGLARVQIKDSVGYINQKGHYAIPLYKTRLSNVQILDSSYLQKVDNHYVEKDFNGKVLQELPYDQISKYRQDGKYNTKGKGEYFIVTKGNKAGLLNRKLQEILPPVYDHIQAYDDASVNVSKGDKCAVIDTLGNSIIPFKYNYINDNNYGVIRVTINQKVGLVNSYGKEIVVPQYDDIDDFVNGMAIITKNDKYGFINNCGEEVIPPIYDEVGEFYGEYFEVKKGEKEYYIDRSGKIIEIEEEEGC